MTPEINYEIHHDREARRFETRVEGFHCLLDYTLADGVSVCVMTITHTSVAPEVRGRGVASGLVRAAMDTARAEHWKVIPACSYADVWVARHSAYHDLQV